MNVRKNDIYKKTVVKLVLVVNQVTVSNNNKKHIYEDVLAEGQI